MRHIHNNKTLVPADKIQRIEKGRLRIQKPIIFIQCVCIPFTLLKKLHYPNGWIKYRLKQYIPYARTHSHTHTRNTHLSDEGVLTHSHTHAHTQPQPHTATHTTTRTHSHTQPLTHTATYSHTQPHAHTHLSDEGVLQHIRERQRVESLLQVSLVGV